MPCKPQLLTQAVAQVKSRGYNDMGRWWNEKLGQLNQSDKKHQQNGADPQIKPELLQFMDGYADSLLLSAGGRILSISPSENVCSSCSLSAF